MPSPPTTDPNARLAQIPNIITVLRILLVLPTAWLLWHSRYSEAFVLAVIAGASDALDGFLARRFNWLSRFGAAMDPVADKLLVIVLFVVFTLQGHLPLWLAVLVIMRDVVILSGAGFYRLFFEPINFSPTFVSKANTALQLVTLGLLLFGLCEFGMVSELAMRVVNPFCFAALAVLGVWSGVDYVVTWGRRAVHRARSGRTHRAP